MKRVKRSITAAEGTTMEDKLNDAISNLKDDFDFLMSGLDKLGRGGAESSNDAMVLAEHISSALQSAISEMSAKLG